jgi:tetratricopeptide (TPR) repeat protein
MMTIKSAMQIVDELDRLLSAGNINTAVILVVENWDALQGVQDRVLESLAYSINSCRHHLSSVSRDRLQTLPADIRARFAPDITIDPSTSSFPPSIGRVWFPVVTSFGMVREMVVDSGPFTAMPKERQDQLDRVGAATVFVIGRRLDLPVVWYPHRYSFRILNPLGREDPEVSGESMNLPLALALYSYLTQAPFPPNVSASAEVCRDGALKAVESIGAKIEALKAEHPGLSRILVAEDQGNIPHACAHLAQKVSDLSCALDLVFRDKPAAEKLDLILNIPKAAEAIQAQYETRLYDTCRTNADVLINYLNGRGLNEPADPRILTLFDALWRRGSCLLHSGGAEKALASLEEAIAVYHRHPDLIPDERCAEGRNSYAVALKDVFHYKLAEDLHRLNEKDLKRIGSKSYIRAKNLSSLSQLYLARRQFAKSAKTQKQALEMIRLDQRERNYGYLVQIFSRWGRFADAQVALDQQQRLLDHYNQKNNDFHRWVKAEFLYRRGLAGKKKKREKDFAHLHALQRQVLPEGAVVGHYTTALILKFDGLARLAEGDEQAGLDQMDACIGYFDTISEPMFPLISAAVRAERALYQIEFGQTEKAVKDVKCVAEVLSGACFFHYFGSQVTILKGFKDRVGAEADAIRSVAEALEFVREAIPY